MGAKVAGGQFFSFVVDLTIEQIEDHIVVGLVDQIIKGADKSSTCIVFELPRTVGDILRDDSLVDTLFDHKSSVGNTISPTRVQNK